MQQNPHCLCCRNLLVIQENDDKYIGVCNKCRSIRILSIKEIEDYLHNIKCKTYCNCEETAHVCKCNFKEVSLLNDTKIYLNKNNSNELI